MMYKYITPHERMTAMNEQQLEKRNKLAGDVLRLSRNTLLVNLRFLDMALSRLKPVATDLTTLCTDGEYLAYDPMFILRRYKQEKEVPVRDYLHVVFHCVFRHMYIHSLMNQTVWDDGYVIRNGILFDYFGNSGDVTIPESVVIISGGAFLDNTELKSVNIHEGVKHIGHYAFSRCRNLKTISISNPETSIGYKAFYGCKGLADKKGFVIYKGILQDYLGSDTDVTIPKGVTEICDSVFSQKDKMTSVTIPDTVTTIGREAFNDCRNLETAVIPDSVRTMGAEVFRSCSSLTAITLPEGLTSIEDGAFDCCKSLTSVSIPSSVISIGERAFGGWCRLMNVAIPESVTHIGEQAFEIKTPVNWVKSPLLPTFSTFPSTGFALLLCGEKKGYYAFASKSNKDNISDFVKTERWNQYDMELINNGPDYKYKVPARLIGALGRLLDPVDLTDDIRELYIELLNKNAKKLVPIAEESGCVDIIKDLFSLNTLDAKTEKAVKKLLAASEKPTIAAIADKI